MARLSSRFRLTQPPVIAAAAILLAASATAAKADFIYGIDPQTRWLYEFDTATSSLRQISTFPSSDLDPSQTVNGFAYDTVNDVFYFVGRASSTGQDSLLSWNRTSASLNNLGETSSIFGASGIFPLNAVFYDSAYWFFKEGSLDLYKVPLSNLSSSPTAGTATITPISWSGSGVTMNPATSGYMTFGDIAINANTGILYGATQEHAFFRVSLNSSDSDYNKYTVIADNSTFPFTLQLSFNADYTKLYGQRAVASPTRQGDWYEINPATGARTSITSIPGIALEDLGGAALTAAEVPAPLPLFGAAAAFSWSRRLRQRLRGLPLTQGQAGGDRRET